MEKTHSVTSLPCGNNKNLSKMNAYSVIFAVTMVTLVAAEAPLPYNYNRPTSSGSSFGGSSFGGSALGGSSFGGSSGGYQSNEGAQVDPQLLEQVRQILLREESQSHSGSAPSSQYGVPSSQYGVPSGPSARVVAIHLENTIPSIEVASFSQRGSAPAPSGGYSYPSAPAPSYAAPSPSYSLPSAGPAPSFSAPSAPSQSYGTPSVPSGSYGAPPSAPSSQYGAPF